MSEDTYLVHEYLSSYFKLLVWFSDIQFTRGWMGFRQDDR